MRLPKQSADIPAPAGRGGRDARDLDYRHFPVMARSFCRFQRAMPSRMLSTVPGARCEQHPHRHTVAAACRDVQGLPHCLNGCVGGRAPC